MRSRSLAAARALLGGRSLIALVLGSFGIGNNHGLGSRGLCCGVGIIAFTTTFAVIALAAILVTGFGIATSAPATPATAAALFGRFSFVAAFRTISAFGFGFAIGFFAFVFVGKFAFCSAVFAGVFILAITSATTPTLAALAACTAVTIAVIAARAFFGLCLDLDFILVVLGEVIFDDFCDRDRSGARSRCADPMSQRASSRLRSHLRGSLRR